MSQTPVTCPKQPLSRDLDVEVFISRPQTELATDMTMIAVLTPDVKFSDGGNSRVRFYTTLESLTNDVAVGSAAYWAGNAFFSRSERPTTMCVGQVFTDPTPAVLRGGPITVSPLRAVTDGGFDILIDGEAQQVRGLDFSAVQTITQAAAVVSAKMRGVQAFADAATSSIVIQTSSTGDGVDVAYATSPSPVGNHLSMIRGTTVQPIVETLKTISTGSLTVYFNGAPYAVGSLDFTSVTSPVDVANLLQVALRSQGLAGLRVQAGTHSIYLSMEALVTGTGFTPCPVSTTGTDIAPLLTMGVADSPKTENFVETTSTVPASIVSGSALDYTALAALTSTTMGFGGQSYVVDFTSVTDLASLVTAINAAVGFSDTYTASAESGKLKIVAVGNGFVTYVDGATGVAMKLTPELSTSIQEISIPAYTTMVATDVSTMLALTESLSSSNTIGYTPGNLVSEAMLVSTAARCAGKAIYGWILDAKYRDTDDQKVFADWCEARNPSIFLACTNSPQAYNSADANNIGTYCYLKGYKRTGVIYHNNPQVYPDMSYLACALSVNYAQQGSSITLKFKQLDGIEPSPLTNTQLTVLQSKNINCYVFIGNTAREVREGTQSLSTWFTDSLVNLDNFREEIQVEVYNVFLRSKKVPYTSSGQNLIVSAASKICARYTRNGVFAPRDIETLSTETGFETRPSTNIQPAPITGATASDRARRLAPPVQITAYEAGAFHKVTLNVSVFN